MDKRTQIILSHAKNCSGNILHVGCADPGCDMDSPDWLHEQIYTAVGGNLVGIDIHKARLEEMARSGYNVALVNATEFTEYFEEAFDLIVAGEIIEHLQNPGQLIHALSRYLTPGGTLLLSTPNPFAITHAGWFQFTGREHHGDEHVLWESPATIRTMLCRYGLRDRKVHFCSYGFKRRRWWWWFLAIFELWPHCRQTILYEVVRM